MNEVPLSVLFPEKRKRRLWRLLFKKRVMAEVIASPAETAMAQSELTLHENIIKLRNLEIYDVMVPRADIIAFEVETEATEILKTAREKTHSRFPVYRESLDDTLGYVQVKALFDAYHQHQEFNLEKICEKPLFIVPSMRVLDLLLQMRYSKIYLAMVVDEYGGVDGLVTIEDLMEAILGTVGNDTNGTSPNIIGQANGTFLIDCRTELEELEEKLGIKLTLEPSERDDIDTVGGLIFYHAGRVPSRGEIIGIEEGVEFSVVDADPRRVKWVRAKIG
jgi:magnesium and cobalt transporter